MADWAFLLSGSLAFWLDWFCFKENSQCLHHQNTVYAQNVNGALKKKLQ